MKKLKRFFLVCFKLKLLSDVNQSSQNTKKLRIHRFVQSSQSLEIAQSFMTTRDMAYLSHAMVIKKLFVSMWFKNYVYKNEKKK